MTYLIRPYSTDETNETDFGPCAIGAGRHLCLTCWARAVDHGHNYPRRETTSLRDTSRDNLALRCESIGPFKIFCQHHHGTHIGHLRPTGLALRSRPSSNQDDKVL